MTLKLMQVLSLISEMTYYMTYYKDIYMILNSLVTTMLSWKLTIGHRIRCELSISKLKL